MLWSMHEANIGDYFEFHDVNGNKVEQGRAVPQLYSKLAASQELRKMLNLGRSDDRNDVARLSDAELIAQLSDAAKELGTEINLNYSFVQPKEPEVACP
jgi:hypothetical protein